MGSPERSGPGNRESNQGKKGKRETIRVRSKKGFSKRIPVTDLSVTGEYHPEGSFDEQALQGLLDFVQGARKESFGVLGRKRVRGY